MIPPVTWCRRKGLWHVVTGFNRFVFVVSEVIPVGMSIVPQYLSAPFSAWIAYMVIAA